VLFEKGRGVSREGDGDFLDKERIAMLRTGGKKKNTVKSFHTQPFARGTPELAQRRPARNSGKKGERIYPSGGGGEARLFTLSRRGVVFLEQEGSTCGEGRLRGARSSFKFRRSLTRCPPKEKKATRVLPRRGEKSDRCFFSCKEKKR